MRISLHLIGKIDFQLVLTYWGQMTHIYVGEYNANFGSDNALLHERHQAIIQTSDNLMSFGYLKLSFAEVQPFYSVLNALK